MDIMMEEIRRELARVMPEDLNDISASTNLLEVGLHSLAIMRLVEPLSRLAETRLDYVDLARQPTLEAWTLLCKMGGKSAGA